MTIANEGGAGAPPCAALCEAMNVNRRTFLSATTLAAVAAVLQSCSGGGGGGGVTAPPPGPPTGGTLMVTVSSFAALSTVGGIARVDGNVGSPTALVRTGATTFTALSMICTHQGTTINISGSGFLCPNHGAQFSSAGANIGGQATSSLQIFSSTFDGTNTVTISRPS